MTDTRMPSSRRLPRAAMIGLALACAVPLAGCQTMARPVAGFTTQQRALLQREGFVETARGWELSVADRLLFDIDSNDVKPEMQTTLTRVANGLISVGIHQARVEGHTDSSGSTEHNQGLSLSRANAVAAVLQAHGFGAADLSIAGFGETMPVASNASDSGRAQNRRVVIIVSAL